LFGRRSDGKVVKEGRDPISGVMPYIMRGRNESAVYYSKSYCIENMQKYIRERRKQGDRITVFNIISATFLHTFIRRPHLNRFVAGRKLYEHTTFDILYVVKTSMTDEGIESIARVRFDADDNLDSVRDKMDAHINAIKGSDGKEDDRFMEFIAKLPRCVNRVIAWILRTLDFYGMMPKALLDLIPMYSSVFLSHMGSIGGDAMYHHLYEFGTTSVFCTIGKVYLKPYRDIRTDEVIWKRTIDLNFTLDERICDGFYFIKSLNLFDSFLDDPSLLEMTPNEAIAEEEQEERERQERMSEKQATDMDTYWNDMLEHPIDPR
jgi:hypothetical protein